jgi:hypothetical protein
VCDCGDILAQQKAQRELATMRPDRYKIALGSGDSVQVYGVVFVADDYGRREVSLCCCECGIKWNLKFGRDVKIEAAKIEAAQ